MYHYEARSNRWISDGVTWARIGSVEAFEEFIGSDGGQKTRAYLQSGQEVRFHLAPARVQELLKSEGEM